MTLPDPDYEVGYQKPPKATQFQKGQSGNPKGRPKGSLNLATALEAALCERRVIRENGQSRTLSIFEIVIKQAVNKAAGGDMRAIQFVTNLLSLYPSAESKDQAQEPDQVKDQQLLTRLIEDEEARKEFLTCQACGSEIIEGTLTYPDGRVLEMTADTVARSTRDKFKKRMCLECAGQAQKDADTKRKEREQSEKSVAPAPAPVDVPAKTDDEPEY